MLKMRFSELFVIIGIFVIDLALLYQFLRYDTNGTLLCIFIFLSFFALLELCFRRGINPMGLMPRAWGRPLCGLLARPALLLRVVGGGPCEGCPHRPEHHHDGGNADLSDLRRVFGQPREADAFLPFRFPGESRTGCQKQPGQGQARQTLLRRCTNARLAGITASHSPTASRSRHAFIIRIPV